MVKTIFQRLWQVRWNLEIPSRPWHLHRVDSVVCFSHCLDVRIVTRPPQRSKDNRHRKAVALDRGDSDDSLQQLVGSSLSRVRVYAACLFPLCTRRVLFIFGQFSPLTVNLANHAILCHTNLKTDSRLVGTNSGSLHNEHRPAPSHTS